MCQNKNKQVISSKLNTGPKFYSPISKNTFRRVYLQILRKSYTLAFFIDSHSFYFFNFCLCIYSLKSQTQNLMRFLGYILFFKTDGIEGSYGCSKWGQKMCNFALKLCANISSTDFISPSHANEGLKFGPSVGLTIRIKRFLFYLLKLLFGQNMCN